MAAVSTKRDLLGLALKYDNVLVVFREGPCIMKHACSMDYCTFLSVCTVELGTVP